ncbi:autophagy-related protein 13 [Favolaschia claudopus]|uniref:Autophagy-related protein 13 n=1 Tax=Favolaschia claudopus TaxID=2862362 RepID=A0AAW0BAR1_9AGAR
MAAGDSAKADQIAFHIYTKLWHTVYTARASDQVGAGAGAQQGGKTDKWFNLETPLAPPGNTPTTELDLYRALSTSSSSSSSPIHPVSHFATPSSPTTSHPTTAPPPPLTIQVLLAVPAPGGGTALVHKPSNTRVEPEPRWVVLEEWVLGFSSSSASTSSTSSAASDTSTSADDEEDVLPSTIYKNAIPLFRALFALLRILPAWRVVRRLAGRRTTSGAGGAGFGAFGGGGGIQGGKRSLGVVVRLRPNTGTGQGLGGGQGGDQTLAFAQSPSPETHAPPLQTSTHVFPGVAIPGRTLTLTTTYLTTPTFTLESLEALLSSRFAVLDAAPAPSRFGGAGEGGRRQEEYPGTSRRQDEYAAARRETDYSSIRGRRAPLGEYGSAGSRRGFAGRAGSQDDDDEEQREREEEEEFVPTLARRSISTSTSTAIGSGMSPGRHTTALPGSPSRGNVALPLPSAQTGTAGSPGRYTSVLRPRMESLRAVASDVPAHAPYRAVSESHASSSSSASPHSRGVQRREREDIGDVVDRFVVPKGGASLSTTTTGMRGSPSAVSPLGEYGPYSHARGAPSEREREREREKGVPIAGAAAAAGPSTGPGSLLGGGGSTGSSGSRPTSAMPMPIAINPFKSNTLSRSSLTGSLLRNVGGVAGSPGRAGGGGGGGGGGSGTTSPMGVVFPPSAPYPPPLNPSGGARSFRRRLHRRRAGALGPGVGSGGSGESGSVSGSVPVRERTASQGQGGNSRSGSFLKSPVDAQRDDISAFVKDIDAAGPLLGRMRQQQQEQQDDDDDTADAEDSNGGGGGGGDEASTSSSPGTSRGGTVRGAGSTLRGTVGPGAPPAQAMLTNQDEVDARLKSMNDEFMRSLVGLGGAGGSGAGRGSVMRAAPATPSPGSGSGISGGGSGSGSGSGGQGSQEVIGRLEFG